MHKCCATRSPANTSKALWCICIFPLFPFKTSELGIHQTAFWPVEARGFLELQTPLVYTFCPSDEKGPDEEKLCKISRKSSQVTFPRVEGGTQFLWTNDFVHIWALLNVHIDAAKRLKSTDRATCCLSEHGAFLLIFSWSGSSLGLRLVFPLTEPRGLPGGSVRGKTTGSQL